jgi:hypothetical protein
VLIRGLCFAEQLHNFEQAIQGVALDSSAAAAIGYGQAQLLLEVRQRLMFSQLRTSESAVNCYQVQLLMSLS